MRDRYAVPHILSRDRPRRLLRPRLRARPGPALADDADAAHGAGAAERDLRAGDARDRRADAGARPLRAMRGRRSTEQTDATRAALEAYADGVNAWLRVVQREALGRGAPEFFLFSPDIAPWTPGQLDRGAEAHGAADDRQGGDGDAAGAAVAGAAAGAAARHPAGFAERAADGAAGVLRALSRTLPARAGRARRRGSPLDPLPRAGARRRLERLRGDRRGGRPAARRSSPPTRTWR